MLVLIILWVNGVAFLAFGLACFFDPSITATLVGYKLTNADSVIEVHAMYGGVQTMIGVFMLLGARSEKYRHASLVFVCLVYAGLAIGRIYGLLIVEGAPTMFTYGAVSFEALMALLSGFCLLNQPREDASSLIE